MELTTKDKGIKETDKTLSNEMKQIKIAVPGAEIAVLCHRYQISELALFGSVLHDDFRPDSDIDILVEFEPEARIGLRAFVRIQRELSALFHRPVDLVPREGLKPLLKNYVLSTAKVIYAA